MCTAISNAVPNASMEFMRFNTAWTISSSLIASRFFRRLNIGAILGGIVGLRKSR